MARTPVSKSFSVSTGSTYAEYTSERISWKSTVVSSIFCVRVDSYGQANKYYLCCEPSPCVVYQQDSEYVTDSGNHHTGFVTGDGQDTAFSENNSFFVDVTHIAIDIVSNSWPRCVDREKGKDDANCKTDASSDKASECHRPTDLEWLPNNLVDST
jgi:hypothetical protein